LAFLERRRRIRCRLPCEVVVDHDRTLTAAVVSLSEGGVGLVAALRVEQGDPIQLRILPHRKGREFTVDALVWNDRPGPRTRGGGRLRQIGCVISDPPRAFLDLMAAQEGRNPSGLRTSAARAAALPETETDLPRSRDPLPPPKPEPEESLSRFRVRLKQVGGPRTRIVSVRACSIKQAAERALSELADSAGKPAGTWEVLEVSRA
jgi:hypothetical protein